MRGTMTQTDNMTRKVLGTKPGLEMAAPGLVSLLPPSRRLYLSVFYLN